MPTTAEHRPPSSPLPPNESDDSLLVMGCFGKTHGIKGFLKVNSYTIPPHNLLNYTPWYVRLRGNWEIVELAAGQTHGKGILAQPVNCPDPETARIYTGLDIAIRREQLPALQTGQYYWSQLQGLRVVTTTGIEFGHVDHLMETGSHDVLVIKDATRDRLIPFVQGVYVISVDLTNKTIVVDWDPEF